MLIRSQATTLPQIFCKLLLYSQVIIKSMRVADDTFYSISECEWVKIYSQDDLVVTCTIGITYHHLLCRHDSLLFTSRQNLNCTSKPVAKHIILCVQNLCCMQYICNRLICVFFWFIDEVRHLPCLKSFKGSLQNSCLHCCT